jgi:hypothetical protein
VLAHVFATLAVAQIVQALRIEVAYRAGANPFDISITLLMVIVPILARQGDTDPLATLIE